MTRHVTIVEGELTATATPDGPHWVFASHGLEAVGQREMLLVVLRDGRPCPESPFTLFGAVHGLARAGTTFAAGGRLGLGRPGLDFDERIGGFLCLPLHPQHPRPAAVDPGGDPLLLVPLFTEELDAAEQVGHARVLARLGKLTRCFPYPWWFDARREPVIGMGEPGFFTDHRIPKAHVPHLGVVSTGPSLTLSLSREDRGHLHALLTAGYDSLVLLPRITATEDARFVWEPGQGRPEAIMRDRGDVVLHGDLAMGANFLALLHGDLATSTRQVEDGFVVMMAEPLWRRFVDAVAEGREFTWRTGGDVITEVRLALAGAEHVSPLGHVYTTANRSPFQEYRSHASHGEQRVRPVTRNVVLEEVFLLTSQHDIAEEITAAVLAAYVDEALQVVDDALEGVAHRAEHLTVLFRLLPNSRPWTAATAEPDVLPRDVTDDLVRRLWHLPGPPIRRTEIRFELRMSFDDQL